jgi:hypothetical protein
MLIENVVLRNVFGPVAGEYTRLHHEELYDLYSSPNTFRMIKPSRLRWSEHVARMGERRVHTKVLVGKPEGKGAFETPRRRWEDNIEIDI